MSLHALLARLLRGAVAVSALVLLVAGTFYLVQHGQEPADFSSFQPVSPELRTPAAIVAAVGRGDAAALAQCGLLLVMVTPLVRESTAAGWFLRRRDLLFAGIGALIAGVLLLSLLLAR
jgi:uncharacterized membrane protein